MGAENSEKKFSKEKLKEYGEKVKTAAGKVSKVVWIIVAVVIAAIVIGLIVYFNTRPYSILVTGASTSEVTTVTTWLEERGVRDYKVQGNTVLVPDRMATALKASLLNEMYVSNENFDWSMYFDNVGMLSTESERDNAWLISVMQQAEAVVTQMEGVEWASVKITPGENRSYVLDSANVVNATAAVEVRTRDGKVLSDGVAQAIRGYVSHCAQGLDIESVDLWDTNGNYYNGTLANVDGVDADASLLKFRLEQELANRIRSEIMQLVVPLFGEKNVRTAVNPTVDVSKTEINEEGEYIPDYIGDAYRQSGQGIIGNIVYDHTDEVAVIDIVGGIVGADRNSDVPVYVEEGGAEADPNRDTHYSGQIDYKNPYRETHTVRTAAVVTDIHVSMTVNSRTAEELNLELLREAVANAAGIEAIETNTMTAAQYLASKVTIYSGPFYQVAPEIVDPWAWWPFGDIIPAYYVLIAAAGLVLFLILLVIIILAAKSHKKKKLAAAALAAEEAERAALEASEEERREAEAVLAEVMGMPQTELVGADVMSLQTEKNMELRQDIRQFVEENPEVAAQLLKTWLRGGDDHG